MLDEYIEYLLSLDQEIDIILAYISTAQYSEGKRQFLHDVILKKLDPNDLAIVSKVLEFAKDNTALRETILQTVGMHFYNKGDYVQALNWMDKIRQGSFVNHISKILADKIINRQLPIDFNIHEIKEEVRNSSALLLFVEDYQELMKLVASKNKIIDYPKALQTLLKMIRNKSLPLEYASKVLNEVIEIIKMASVEELELLMQILTDAEFEGNVDIEETNKVRKVLIEVYQSAIING